MADNRQAEATSIPANIARTMPYTAIIGVGSCAVIFRSRGPAWLFLGLILNEGLIAGAKVFLRKAVGGESKVLRRPEGAMDSGIFPMHFPRASTTSGMPSGHSQAMVLLAVVFSSAIVFEANVASDDQEDAETRGLWHALSQDPSCAASLCYVWLIALAVVLSRTRFGGPLCVKIDGRRIAHHTVAQVAAGAAVGCCLGLAASGWYFGGKSWYQWIIAYFVVLLAIAFCAKLEARACGRFPCSPEDSDSSNKPDSNNSDSDRSTSQGSSSDTRSTDLPASTVGSELELRPRPVSRLPDSSLPNVMLGIPGGDATLVAAPAGYIAVRPHSRGS